MPDNSADSLIDCSHCAESVPLIACQWKHSFIFAGTWQSIIIVPFLFEDRIFDIREWYSNENYSST